MIAKNKKSNKTNKEPNKIINNKFRLADEK